MSIEDDIALLESVPMLQLLGRDALRVIAISADARPLAQGEVLFREGQFAEAAYVVASGIVSVGRENAALAKRAGQTVRVGRGGLLGEMALLTESKRPATATAVEPAIVLRIPRVIFMRTIESYPDAAARLMQAVAARVDHTLAELDGVRRHLEAIAPAPRRPR